MTPIVVPWVNLVMKDDAEARAITMGAMVRYAYTLRFTFVATRKLQKRN
jgi:hypothetical protein